MSNTPMHKSILLRGIAAAALLLISREALAWGSEGHRIVAHIAERRLTDEARAQLKALLLPDQQISDASICCWPDYIRSDEPETAPWHYVDIPYAATAYDPALSCPSGQCVIAQVDACEKTLSDTNAPTEVRTRALRFLVHFVGDLHQPLHCADRDDDRGGNDRTVRYPGQWEDTNLHSVWDSNLVRADMGNLGPLEYADVLNDQVSGRKARRWSKGTTAEWAWEAHALAVSRVYAGVPPTGGAPFPLDAAYIAAGRTVVQNQLTRAGLRLAAVLNRCLGQAPAGSSQGRG